VTNSRYTSHMSDKRRLTWEPDELQPILAAHHAEFDEQYRLLMAKLEKPLPIVQPPALGKQSALGKRIDAHLKALQERVRNLPPHA
jgi:hypothetical protein